MDQLALESDRESIPAMPAPKAAWATRPAPPSTTPSAPPGEASVRLIAEDETLSLEIVTSLDSQGAPFRPRLKNISRYRISRTDAMALATALKQALEPQPRPGIIAALKHHFSQHAMPTVAVGCEPASLEELFNKNENFHEPAFIRPWDTLTEPEKFTEEPPLESSVTEVEAIELMAPLSEPINRIEEALAAPPETTPEPDCMLVAPAEIVRIEEMILALTEGLPLSLPEELPQTIYTVEAGPAPSRNDPPAPESQREIIKTAVGPTKPGFAIVHARNTVATQPKAPVLRNDTEGSAADKPAITRPAKAHRPHQPESGMSGNYVEDSKILMQKASHSAKNLLNHIIDSYFANNPPLE